MEQKVTETKEQSEDSCFHIFFILSVSTVSFCSIDLRTLRRCLSLVAPRDNHSETTMKPLRIGEVARQSNVGIETIRYYEREGLLTKPERGTSGYRQYDDSVVLRLQFIRRSKELGFTLGEIKELLALWYDRGTKCVHVRQKAEEKIAEIEAKIRSLQKMRRSLKRLVDQCEGGDSVAECPLLIGIDVH